MIKIPKVKDKIYHSTADYFTDIDLRKGKKYKDFGNGFYLSYYKEHAERKARIMANLKNKSNKYVYIYPTIQDEFAKLYKMRKAKVFEVPNLEWADFILESRTRNHIWHDYDVVIGPTADDDTRVILDTYREGGYGAVGSFEARDTLIRLLHPEKLATQVFIATDAGLNILDIRNREVIKL